MAQVATVTARMVIQEGSETRTLAGSHSDKTVLETNQWTINVATGNATKLSLYSMNTNAGPKAIYVESDSSLQVHWSNTSGAGWTVRAGGFVCGVVTNTTSVWVKNGAASGVALATIAVHLLSTV